MADKDTTAYTTDEIPRGMWEQWKELVPRSKKLGSRIVRLIAADVASKSKHGVGLIELVRSEGLLDDSDLEDAESIDPDDS